MENEKKNFDDLKQLRWFIIQHYDNCSVCGKQFGRNENSYMGHLTDGSCGHTCEECSKQMVDARIYTNKHNHPNVIPNSSAKLWRYMDLSKFLSLLESRSLYFTRLDHFSDSFEGAIGSRKNESAWEKMQIELRSKWILAEHKSKNMQLSDKEITNLAYESFEKYRRNIKEWRMHNYVSCWHQSDFESEAMWQLYTRDNKQGIAIQTTFERLYQALSLDPWQEFGMVKYINFDEYNNGNSQKSFHSFDALWYKRESFAHEKEFRIIIEDSSKGCLDWEKTVEVNLNMLIENVYISPEADLWFYELVKDIIRKRYNLRLDVKQSALNDLPFY